MWIDLPEGLEHGGMEVLVKLQKVEVRQTGSSTERKVVQAVWNGESFRKVKDMSPGRKWGEYRWPSENLYLGSGKT